MAKKSQKRPPRNEKDHAGCISGLINIFDFRHGRSNRKLLGDRRRGNRQGADNELARARLTLPDSNVKHQDSEDGGKGKISFPDKVKSSVKKLMEEEMFNNEGQKKQINDSEVGQKKSDAEFGSHNRKLHRRSKTSHLIDLGAAKVLKPDKSCDHLRTETTLDNSDLETIVQELCQTHRKTSSHVEHLQNDSSPDAQLDQISGAEKEKLIAAIKVFVDQRLYKSKHYREDGQVEHSEEFMDALHRVSSNKDLLLKFLQDPNSLLVKQIKRLEEGQFERDKETNPLPRPTFLEQKATLSKTDDLINQKPRGFFRRRSKSQEHFPVTASDRSQSSSKIVILKPGPANLRQPDYEINLGSSIPSRYPTGNKIHGEKSQFSFTEIKRKLKHAIRKDRPDISSDGIVHNSRPENKKRHYFDKRVSGENVGWCSPNRNHFYMERFAKPCMSFKRGETIGNPIPTRPTLPSEATTVNDHLKPRISNIYLEARKHLLEMLSTGNGDAELTSQKLPRSLGRILSFSEYTYSPILSPRKDREEILASTPVKLSPRATVQSVNESTNKLVEENVDSHPSPSKPSSEDLPVLPCENSEEKIESPDENASVPHDHSQSSLVEEMPSLTINAVTCEGIEEMTSTLNHEADDVQLASSESSTLTVVEDTRIGDSVEECDEDRSTQLLKMESIEKSQMSSSPPTSPSHTSVTKKVEDSEDPVDKIGRPSPVSVLDPLFAEDDISPARTISRPAELEIQPRQIEFEEQRSSSDLGICMQTSLQDEESAFEYVEAVLLGSGLNWDEYLPRWLSLCPILDSVLFDEVELFSSRSCAEQKLLFDCTNEVLEEVCDRYFGSFIGMSCGKQTTRPIPKAMDLILEIWRGVEWNLLQYPPPQSLEQLVRKDLGKSRLWMDLRADTEDISEEMEKAILETLLEDAISSFLCDTSDSNFIAVLADSSEVES